LLLSGEIGIEAAAQCVICSGGARQGKSKTSFSLFDRHNYLQILVNNQSICVGEGGHLMIYLQTVATLTQTGPNCCKVEHSVGLETEHVLLSVCQLKD
jgi:hypothetical protein